MGSSKRVIDNENYVKVGDAGADLAASFTFPIVDVLHLDSASFSVAFTGNCIGTMSIEESNDGVFFNSVSGGSLNIVSGTGGGYVGGSTKAKFVRLRYVRTSGSGTVAVHMVAKSNS